MGGQRVRSSVWAGGRGESAFRGVACGFGNRNFRNRSESEWGGRALRELEPSWGQNCQVTQAGVRGLINMWGMARGQWEAQEQNKAGKCVWSICQVCTIVYNSQRLPVSWSYRGAGWFGKSNWLVLKSDIPRIIEVMGNTVEGSAPSSIQTHSEDLETKRWVSARTDP